MPRRKKYVPKRKAPVRRYKKKSYPRKNMISPSGVPTVRFVKMRYVTRIPLTTGVAVVSAQFRANSIFDPEVALGGHQPMGHDTMSTLYNHYTVVGSKLTCDWASQISSGDNGIMVGCYLSDDGVYPYTDYTGMVEAKKGTYRSIVKQRNSVKTTTGFSAKKFFNLSDVKDNQQRVGAVFGQNPVDEAVFVVWAQAHDFGATNTVSCVITLDYAVVCGEPKELGQS